MNMHVPVPTPTELSAHNRRMAFRQRIAERAAAVVKPTPVVPIPAIARPAVVPMPCGLPDSYFLIQKPDRPAGAVPPISLIQQMVAQCFGVTVFDILSERRQGYIIIPRQLSMYLAKELTPKSLIAIGRLFGGRDHTTVLHALRKIAKLIETDQELADLVAYLRREIAR